MNELDFIISKDLKNLFSKVLDNNYTITIPKNREHLIKLAFNNEEVDEFEVGYLVPDKGYIAEAIVTRCKNGAVVNYNETYMRRRDPDCMYIGDNKETDKKRYYDKFSEDFNTTRDETFAWLEHQDLIVMPFMSGDNEVGYESLLVCPKNAGFFAAGLADLQGFIPQLEIPNGFSPKAIVYVAPPFRHTHFKGKQIVVHNRTDEVHEIFSYNLYPGPSAKKGIYGVLLNIGEEEGWVTLHASSVKLTTPYDLSITIMHEGASGGGKSEMIEEIHRESDGRVLFGVNTINDEKIYMDIKDTVDIRPITDDMALNHPEFQKDNKKLVVKDAENGWFLRFNHITEYGTSPEHEKLCTHPKEPLIFLNMQAVPRSTCLIWNHIMDEPEIPCPNPRVIMPRRLIKNVVNEPIEIDIRSFGVRVPKCTKDSPSYGIVGCLHVLPPALAWLWRLVAPRGHSNPSINDTEGMSSEGVGSYWPFATGKRVEQANLLLRQIINTPDTRYVLIPNQHIGAYSVGFMPQWIAREYLTRRGSAKFKNSQLIPSRCSLLGYSLESIKVEGIEIPRGLLQTNLQLEVGNEAYDKGALELNNFFVRELKQYLTPELDPIGRKIIETCLNNGTLDEYIELIPTL